MENVELEVQSDSSVSVVKPLCAHFAQFKQHSEGVFEALDGFERKGRTRDRGLPILYEKLWVAQDTGDLAAFKQAQREIFEYWKKSRENWRLNTRKRRRCRLFGERGFLSLFRNPRFWLCLFHLTVLPLS